MEKEGSMRIDVLTLFPQMFAPILEESILGRAQKEGLLEIRVHDIRDYTLDKHRKTDDYPFGGGAGMVLYPQPVSRALASVGAKPGRIIYMSPRGRLLTQERIEKMAAEQEDFTILCGHYEGVDQRALDYWQMEEISIGDYILTGGELPAMVLIDGLARFVPGVLGNNQAHREESICSGLLEYPQYTKPRQWEGMQVPPVLLSGHHKNIHLWQFEQSLGLTYERRPDLFGSFLRERAGSLSREEKKVLEGFLEEKAREERSMKAPCEKQNEEKGNP